ncbi:putative ribonuclease H-like domain-containing protein [Tanacetum coccineum]
MDVKSAFLYGKIDEEVYVSQPPGFIDPKYPKKVYKVVKALYGLHQAPRAWYATLSTFLLKSGYRRGTIDKTLFIKKDKNDIMLMSSMGELTFFLGLQVKQKEDGIFISQDKYVAEILKKFDFASVKTTSTLIETQKPLVKDKEASDVDVHLYRSMIVSLMYLTASRPDIMFAVCACSRFQVTPKTSHLSVVKRIFRYLKGKPKLGLWYPRVSSFDLEAYLDSDYAGANLDRKSTTGEAEYVAAANCCRQVLWIQNQMLDYGFNFMNTKIYIDNESTICIVKNLVFHSKTKHIAIRHHFIRDAYEKKLIQVLKIHTDDNVADLLTKAFDVSRESLERDIDGTEELLLPDLFIFWLTKVSTDSAKLIPLGKDSTAIKTLEKIPPRYTSSLIAFFYQTLIFYSSSLLNLSSMAVLESCPKHNMVTYLEKTDGNTKFHEIISFLRRSSIHYALTVSPVVSTTFVEQFWMSAKSKLIKNAMYITARVAGKPVSISEASIRSDLLFNDADGIDSLPNQAIFNAIQLMGYEGDLTNEGDTLERQSEPQPIPSPPHPSTDQHETQTNPSPRPLPTSHITDSIPEGSGRNHGEPKIGRKEILKETVDANGRLKLTGRNPPKLNLQVHKDPAFDELDDDAIDYMRLRMLKMWVGQDMNVHEEKERHKKEGTDKQKVSTNKEEVSTDRPDEGTVDQNEGRSATQTAPTTTTPTIFGDDETIAQKLKRNLIKQLAKGYEVPEEVQRIGKQKKK